MTKITSGVHLAVVRQWIQQNAVNGSTVIWGSNEPLEFTVTSAKLEELSQQIRDAVLKKAQEIFDHEELRFGIC